MQYIFSYKCEGKFIQIESPQNAPKFDNASLQANLFQAFI